MLTLASEWQAAVGGVFADRNIRLRERSRDDYRKWLVKVFGFIGKPVADVSYADFENWLVSYISGFEAEHGREPRLGTLNQAKAAVRWFYREAKRIGVVQENLGERIRLYSTPDVEAEQVQKEKVSVEEFKALYGACHHQVHRLLLRTAWETIRRPNEVLSIEWENVDLQARSIYFPRIKVGSLRTASISVELAKMLMDWKAKQDPVSEYVFTYRSDRPIATRSFQKFLTNLVARVGIPRNITPHCLRGSGALFYRNVLRWPLEKVQQQGGWSKTDTLVKKYFGDEVHERARLMEDYRL